MEPLVQIKNLHISFNTYAGEVKAVRGVSFDIYKGEMLGVVGESGCGKSVTSNAIMRILPTPPAEYKQGEIIMDGKNLLGLSESHMQRIRGKDIGMIFQDSMASLNPTMNVGSQIAEVIRRHQKVSSDKAKRQAIEMLHLVGLSNPEKRYHQYPHEFSGGMRQRAMIAIALALNPKLLIADEPTTALDVTIQDQILKVMKTLIEKSDASVMLITHDLGVVAETCRRVVVMYAGQIIEQGAADHIFYNAKHPYTKGLLLSVPSMKMDKTKALEPIVGSPPDLFSPPAGCPFYARCKYAMKICKDSCPVMEAIPENDGEAHEASCWLNSLNYREALGERAVTL